MKLNVGEVSLVDSPANEVEFLVTKNLEENVMGEQHQNAAERVEIEQAAGGESDVASVLKHVSTIVENIAKAVKAEGGQASVPAIVAATPAAADDDEDEADVEKSIADALKAAGIEPTEEQMKKMKKAGFDPSQKFPTAKKPLEKTAKAAKPTESETAAETVLTIEGLSSLIAKAKKFTPTREAALKSAVEALKALLEDISEIPQGTNPGVSPSGTTTFGASGIKGSLTAGDNVDTSKSKDATMADVLKAVQGLAKVVEGLGTEVESIKKARPASESLEAKGGTDTETKKSAGMWSGLL